MQDRPTTLELLDAVRRFLEGQVVPALDGVRQFHARVAANVLAIVGRELRDADAQLRGEWRRLTALGLSAAASGEPPAEAGVLRAAATDPPAEAGALRTAVAALNAELAARVRAGDADAEPFRSAVLAHLRATADEKLCIANPGYRAEGA
jgi:predicted helicase